MPGVRSIERKTPACVCAVRGRHHVLLDRHVQEEPQRLERARDAAAGDLVRLRARRCSRPSSRMSPVVRPVDAGDQVEERRLAGAVRADHADDLALVDVRGRAPSTHLQAAERERDALQLEQALGHQTISTRRSPSSPFGRTIISTIRISAEQDVARRLRLREHHVLPDERGEVERRHEQRRSRSQPLQRA